MAAFTTVFFIFGLGFAIQRLRPLSEQTLAQLSWLVVEVLLPFYLFFIMATSVTFESLSAAPVLIAMGLVVTLTSYVWATLAQKPARVAPEQRSAFRFSIMIANTAFLGIPICAALFGPVGAVYAVLYDFGTTIVILTLGIWVLNGGHLDNWRPLFFNPLIWGVVAGLGWAFSGWPFPEWLAGPFSTLGDATLPLALLVGGAQIGNIQPAGLRQLPLAGLITTRLIVVPITVFAALAILGWHGLFAQVTILQAAMPVGITTVILAKNYGADAKFAASAIFWSTLFAIVSLPIIVILLI
ncbi:MAG: AEC family transporter [Chloroflexota bacterium]|nr:AEC family transporter [Chloroflexota bacterium]